MLVISVRRSAFLFLLSAGLTGLVLPLSVAETPTSQKRDVGHRYPDPTSIASKPTLAADYGKLPLSFEANRGQSDSQVKFLSRGNGYSLFLTDSAAVLALTKRGHRSPTSQKRDVGHPDSARTNVVRMELVGAAKGLAVTGDEKLPGTANYFIGNDPAKWHADVPTYARVKYAGVYPGVDLVYYGNQRQLEYDFVVGPHADARAVRLRFAGAQRLKLDGYGDLRVMAQGGEIAFHKPVVYQMRDGKREAVDGRFQLMAKNEVGFRLGEYDAGRELVIDPTLSYSTYLGGNGTYAGDYGNAIAVDAEGNVYVTGSTGSTNFPVMNPYQKSLIVVPGAFVTIQNAFVTKINPTGTALVYSTYLGGSDDYRFGDAGRGIAVDATGAAYVTGTTGSTDFPITSNAYQAKNKTVAASGSYTGFVTKFSPGGNSLVYSTFLGGSGVANCCNVPYGDTAQGIALDAANEAVVAGYTSSKDFPVLNAIQTVNRSTFTDYYGQASGYNAFVSKVNAAGSGLIFSTYLGGTGQDAANGVAVDGQGSAYIVGTASSTNFPVSSDAYQKVNRSTSTYAPTNAFISKFNASGNTLVYSTYLGGTGEEFVGDGGASIAIDPDCYAYATGAAGSENFPVMGAYQGTSRATANTSSTFVTKLNTMGSGLIYSTYLSGDITDSRIRGDIATGIQVDAAGEAYVTGFAQSTDFPVTANAYQSSNGEAIYAPANYYSGNPFIAKFNAAGNGLLYGSYLGGSGGASGSGGDTANGIAIDSSGNAYLTGSTFSQNFPVYPNPGAFQSVNNGSTATNHITSNAFVAKFGIGSGTNLTATTTTVTADANPGAEFAKITFTADVTQSTACGFPPTGTVSFVIDGGVPVKVTLDDTGHADYATSTLAVGKHRVAVSYSGDSRYAASSAAILNESVIAEPLASVSPTSFTFSNTSVGSTAAYKVFTVSNTGSASLVVSSIAVSGANASSFSVPSSHQGCKTVAAGASCTFDVAFTPATTGSLTASVLVTDNAGGSPQMVAVSGTGVAAVAAISPASFAFAATTVGSTAAYKVFTLTNTGNASLVVSSIAVSGTNASSFSIPSNHQTCKTVTAGASCTFDVAFTPAAEGSFSASVLVKDNASGSPQTVAVSGTGVAAVATVSPTSIAFASAKVGSTAAYKVVTITNAGNSSLVVASIGVSGVDASSFSIPSNHQGCKTVAAGSSCTFDVAFTPAAAGSLTASVSITDNAGGSPQSVVVSGTGVAAAVVPVEVDPAVKRVPGPFASIPYFSPGAGTYDAAQSERIGDTTAGAVVYYTTNGATPTTASTKYVGPISIGATETLKAIAVAPGYYESGEASGVYTIQ